MVVCACNFTHDSLFHKQPNRGDLPIVEGMTSRPAHNDAFTTEEGEEKSGIIERVAVGRLNK